MTKTITIQFHNTYENGKVKPPTKCLVCGQPLTKTTYAVIHIGKQIVYTHGSCYDIPVILDKLKSGINISQNKI